MSFHAKHLGRVIISLVAINLPLTAYAQTPTAQPSTLLPPTSLEKPSITTVEAIKTDSKTSNTKLTQLQTLQQKCVELRLSQGYQPIASVEDLFAFGLDRNNFRGGLRGNAVVTRDIDFRNVPDSVFEPLGTFPAPVNGQLGFEIRDYEKHFDGCNHTFSNLRARFVRRPLAKLFSDDVNAYGLFAQIGGHGAISNLTLNNFTFAFTRAVQPDYEVPIGYAGLLAGRAFGSINNIRVVNGSLVCGASLPDGSWEGSYTATCGGVVGHLRAGASWSFYPNIIGSMHDISSSATVLSEFTVGGIAGLAEGPIQRAKFLGTVRAGDIAGGIVGRTLPYRGGNVIGAPHVRDSVAIGTIETGPVPHPTASLTFYSGSTGGIIGLAQNFMGIIERTASLSLVRSMHTSYLSSSGAVGGIIGYLEAGAGVRDSYSQASIEVAGSYQLAGGIVGYVYGASATISHVYFAGELPNNRTTVFPIVGSFVASDLLYTDCASTRSTNFFRLPATIAQTYSTNCGLGLNETQMRSSQNYIDSGWSPTVWNFPPGEYPQLR